ncbi:hypothetical protein D4T97_000895 [Siminovitchia acidinfaciens]|uniref:Uncharacterized protein n=1 Tax=Siminovitchia acidinfaciens TaxID=2321395 RepID=A0A429Y6R9_9BACI|nr:hypothetical protein [Siminovitchia acidinfaciens]RST77088.1 hypothetical protein D4T97_000895 [Siminovitchia acidinfaciens]
MKSFLDFIGLTEATSSPCRPQLDREKSGDRLISPDKHKTSAEEGVLCLQQRLAYDLEGLGVVAGQEKCGGRLIREKPGYVRLRR